MRRLMFALVLLTASPALADSALTSDFEAASERALAGDRAEAIALYESILARGGVHEDVYFDLGNVYAQDGRLLDAVIAYERALRLAPGDDDVKKNLATVRAELLGTDELAPPEELSLADVVAPLVAPFPRTPIFYALLVFNAAWVALLFAARRRPLRAPLVAVAVVTILLGLIVAGHVVVGRDPRGVALESTPLHRGPNARYERRGDVSAGARIRVIEEEAGWLHVQNADGTTGWLLAKNVERI